MYPETQCATGYRSSAPLYTGDPEKRTNITASKAHYHALPQGVEPERRDRR